MFVRGLCFELFCSNYSHTLLLRDLTLSRSLSLSHLFSTGSVPLPLTLSPPPSERERACARASARALSLSYLFWDGSLSCIRTFPPPPHPPLSLWSAFSAGSISSQTFTHSSLLNLSESLRSSLSCHLPAHTRVLLALGKPMSRSQLISVKYVYAVDCKSMIGGYRTLLVMNSVNPLLIPLRYLNHV